MSKVTSSYIVRTGAHKGQYITLRVKPTATNKKYSWTAYKNKSVSLTYEQARGVVRRYGGEIVKV